jgi:hypothetical protein
MVCLKDGGIGGMLIISNFAVNPRPMRAGI